MSRLINVIKDKLVYYLNKLYSSTVLFFFFNKFKFFLAVSATTAGIAENARRVCV